MVGEELGRQGLEFGGLGGVLLLDGLAVADGVCWGEKRRKGCVVN